MREVTVFETFDGLLHTSKEKALHHLDVERGKVLNSVAHQLNGCPRFVDICSWLDDDTNLEKITLAKKKKKDMVLEEED